MLVLSPCRMMWLVVDRNVSIVWTRSSNAIASAHSMSFGPCMDCHPVHRCHWQACHRLSIVMPTPTLVYWHPRRHQDWGKWGGRVLSEWWSCCGVFWSTTEGLYLTHCQGNEAQMAFWCMLTACFQAPWGMCSPEVGWILYVVAFCTILLCVWGCVLA